MGSQGRVLIAQFLRFNLVGAITVGLGTAVFVGMIYSGLHYVVALIGDYMAGAIFSYFANKTFTFKVQTENDVKPMLKTIITYMFAFGLNVLLLSLAIEIYGFNKIVSQIIIMILLAILNFTVFKLIIFRRLT